MLVHDHWTPYQAFDACTMSSAMPITCVNSSSSPTSINNRGPTEMAQLLCDIKAEVIAACSQTDSLAPDRLAHFEIEYAAILQRGFQANPSPADPVHIQTRSSQTVTPQEPA